MSTANFTIIKQCEHCSKMFEAQKRTTRFCSQKCASGNYKLRKRLALKKYIEQGTQQTLRVKPKVSVLSLELIKDKEYLTVNEAAVLFGCSKRTVYRMVKDSNIMATNLRQRLTRIKRKNIEQLFEIKPKDKPKVLKIEDCYQMNEIVNKYKVSRNTVYGFVTKYRIERIKQNGITYYSQSDIDDLFIK